METNPLDCPACDWKNDPVGLPVAERIAALLDHIEQTHCDPLPPPVREGIKACKREVIDQLPV